jgi:hypothetical protein
MTNICLSPFFLFRRIYSIFCRIGLLKNNITVNCRLHIKGNKFMDFGGEMQYCCKKIYVPDKRFVMKAVW